jgi:hypothetical protein
VTASGVPVPDNDSVAVLFDALLVSDNVPETAPLAFGAKTTLSETLCPAAMVIGNVAPFKVNRELLLEEEETVTLAPEALSVMGCASVLPTLTLPKLNGAGAIARVPLAAAIPVPDRDSVAVLFDALLASDSVPDAAPLALGAKATLRETLCPEAMVIGSAAPLRVKRELLLEAEETVTLAPEALTVMGCVAEVPTFTLPKFNGAGAIVNVPVTAVPVPAKDSVAVLFDALLASDRVADADPDALGAKATFNETL